MRRLLFPTLFSMSVIAASAGSSTAEAVSPLGLWARGDGVAKVKIAPCGGKLCATNTWIKPGTSGEKAGDVLVMSVKKDGEAYTGSAFDPQRNLTVSMTMTVKPQTMVTRGCVLGGILCKSVKWSRIE